MIALLWLFAEYRRVPEAFIPDENYRCWPSYHHKGCLLSVFDVSEAIEICDSYSQCKAFVLTNQTTWTGRSQMLQNRSSSCVVYSVCFRCFNTVWGVCCARLWEPRNRARKGVVSEALAELIWFLVKLLFASHWGSRNPCMDSKVLALEGCSTWIIGLQTAGSGILF